MRASLLMLFMVSAASVATAGNEAQASAKENSSDSYARWVGREKKDLVEFWGQPHKTRRKNDGSVLVYRLRVTCDGIITGTQITQLGKGVVTRSQDPLDGIEQNVPQGATQRAGSRVAARQTVRFFLDSNRVVTRYEATKTKTNWNRCKY